MKTNMDIWPYLSRFSLELEIFQVKFAEKIKTLILCSVAFFFFFENCTIYDKIWKNIVEPGRPQTTI